MNTAEPALAEQPKDLSDTLDLMKRELDALQVTVMAEKTPWYKQVPVVASLIVSIGALLFSFWTNSRSEDRIEREARHDARVELRGLIQRLQVLPKENLELYRTYADDPDAQRQLGGFITTENLVLGQQAVDLIEEIGDVTATEYYAAAYALYSTGQFAEAEAILESGLTVADDPLNEAALLRQLALVRFSVSDLSGGREAWERALGVYERYPEPNGAYVASNNAYTEISWALAELGARECTEAWMHVAAAEQHTTQLDPVDALNAQRDAAEEFISERCGPRPTGS